ncbi:MAG TPA: tRNA (guanine(46)-N(7))-methyltransferase TrmB [Alphaproteobacteria bacterium]|nr:tRNA (guanine(46)-N(7))-methyltransferase TrmB [Alphaproteobacteria bacterium]
MTTSPELTDRPAPPRLFGRRLGRPLKAARAQVLETLLPHLDISLPEVSGVQITPEALFPDAGSLDGCWMEIGFGNGEHLAALMDRHPATGFIGVEPFRAGLSMFLKSIRGKSLTHIRVFADDAMMLVDRLAGGCLDGIYILNPDPWPKKRHHKRRIVSAANLDRMARVLKSGGKLVMATDVDDLADWMVTQAVRHPAFVWASRRADDWRVPPADWIETRYEVKGRQAGRRQTYLFFTRR